MNALSFSQFIERSGNKTALFLATFKNMTNENVKFLLQHNGFNSSVSYFAGILIK